MKRWLKKGLLIGLSVSLCTCFGAQARIVPMEEFLEVEKQYHSSDVYENRFIMIDDLQINPETGEVTFVEEGTLVGEREVEFPDLVYVVNDNTDIGETEENFEKFKDGKLTWVNVCVEKSDLDKVYNEGLRRVHVKYICWFADQMTVYPTAEEKEMGRVLSKKGIMVGDETGIALYRILTRAELAKMAVMIYNPSLDTYSGNGDIRFNDVDENHWANKYIDYAANELRVINGYEDGSFRPDEYATTEEAVKVFACILGIGVDGELVYPDGYIEAAGKNGLSDGVELYFGQGIMRRDAARLALNVLNIWGVVTD